MRRARRGLGLALAACLWAAGTAARGGDYTWVAPGAGSWSTASNWSPPGGPPRSAGDRAIFSASGGGNCTALLPVDCGTLEVRAGYAGTLAGLSLKFKQVFVGGGTVLAAVTCNGDVEYASGVLTSLILEGEGVFSGTNGMALFSIENRSGVHTQKNLFEAASFGVSAGTYVLDTLSALIAGVVNIHAPGRLVLRPGSGLASLGAVNVAGTVDARAPGTALASAGDWTCSGPYLTSGTLLNQLILMQADGGLVNHGDNPADNVVIRGATGQITRWQSSNALVGLQVLPDTTLQLESGAIVTVTEVMVNLGRIIEVTPAHLAVASSLTLSVSGDPAATQVTLNQGLAVTLADPDENLDGTVFDTVEVQLFNPRNGDRVAVSLIESGSAATGVFNNAHESVLVHWGGPAAADGRIQALPGDRIEARYQDAEDRLDSSIAVIEVADIGAPTPTPPPGFSAADFNRDGAVDELDLLMLVERNPGSESSYDLDRSGDLDHLDLFMFAKQWKE